MIEIREIRDIDELMRWRGEVIMNVFGETPSDELLAANRDYYTRNIANGCHHAYVANCSGVEAGCGSVCLSEELPSPDNPSGKCGYLMNIYVKSEFRQHGVGHAIVKQLIEEARKHGCGKIYLETTNEGRSLYESLGFRDLPDMMKLVN